MKKTSVYFLLSLSAFLFSCGGSSTEGEKTATTGETSQKAMMAMRAPSTGMTTIPAPTGAAGAHLFLAVEAINCIDNYAQFDQKIQQNSFVFNTQHLLDYINASQSSIVNFIIGSNAAKDSLFLFVAPVGGDGQHQFYDRNDSCFVLTETYAVAIPTTLEPQDTSLIDTFFMEAMEKKGAQTMIEAYSASTKLPKNNGWLYNANDLAGYLQAGINAGGMQYTQLILALDDEGKADLIIVGSNDGTNHMYFNFNQKQCVMENTKPCPVCDIASGGTTFDPPPCTFTQHGN